MSRNWYVIHTYSGYENKVKANLEKRVESMGMEDKIFTVLVPMEEQVKIKDGKRKITKKKIFPGYVIVEMIVTADSWYVVRNTPGVTGFVGSGTKPIPLMESEVKAILKQMGIEEAKPKIDLEVNQKVRLFLDLLKILLAELNQYILKRKSKGYGVNVWQRTPVELDLLKLKRCNMISQ